MRHVQMLRRKMKSLFHIQRSWISSRKGLARLVQDPLLCDLPIQVTLEEVNSQIALEYGQAMTVKVVKADGEVMPIVVVQNATVLDLKKAICRFMELKQQREGGVKHVSW
ncbi:U11/U12 small nuclear ribonucleoprotein 25 kDa protein [Oryzias melastigma]|uniref:U11/U12 small nuclear ribonucleoprotein 25 kDa protein n=1 Tax=Oryzias melastigma TaxID=30732 RepID=A0A834CEG5_ORYME|nr:U11/U12 small nuclear ribonucleoprotein 25 kDa protein [Oryzias melastigma]